MAERTVIPGPSDEFRLRLTNGVIPHDRDRNASLVRVDYSGVFEESSLLFEGTAMFVKGRSIVRPDENRAILPVDPQAPRAMYCETARSTLVAALAEQGFSANRLEEGLVIEWLEPIQPSQ